MALKSVSIWILLLLCVPGHGQRLSLYLYDFLLSGNALSLRNEVCVDSVAAIEGGISFHPTEPLLYFTKQNGGRWEIISFDLQSRERQTICVSGEKLSHPQITPDLKYISCVSGEDGSLKKYALSGQRWLPVLSDTPVENYEWMDENALLIIDNKSPNQLQLVTLRPRKNVPVAVHVGRVLQQEGNTFSFVHKLSVDSWSIKRINRDGSIEIVTQTLPESDLFTLAGNGRILLVSEDQIFGYAGKKWYPYVTEELHRHGVIKSMGVNASGDKLFVLFAAP